MWRCFIKDDNLFEKSVSAQMPRCLGQMPRYLEISFKISCELSGLLINLEVTSLLPKSSSQGQHEEVLMTRIRTINEAVQMIKHEDPDSSITAYFIRMLAYNEKIRSVKTGSKVMVDFDSLLAFLQSKEYALPMEQIKIN